MVKKEVFIVSAVRTPLGSFGGVFADISATQLGAIAIKGALEKAKVNPKNVNEVFMGNVCSANLGQAPARQAALSAGISNTVPCTTVNKVCSSGAKSIVWSSKYSFGSSRYNCGWRNGKYVFSSILCSKSQVWL